MPTTDGVCDLFFGMGVSEALSNLVTSSRSPPPPLSGGRVAKKNRTPSQPLLLRAERETKRAI